ncbi:MULTISPECIES: hypothetical protein [unclassified Tenacibaculum]|uniref:hypothetical protein n=1 Tax=unclassified Tenacibaculum TaxID=2635139 RepID=UPI001F15ACDC|nr:MULTISPECIES: hypothetical protein [unclassified Tenacibaculum]MCF2873555.1 hypothetical protein [Tenacibaculum sp. Cn5-1]MCF2933711.1 hypothetical protein [Tenacibaculum sp. Cn5-34]MCG7509707.1 hypothetical protein [Tenacibaculum sp. Cn5-46]
MRKIILTSLIFSFVLIGCKIEKTSNYDLEKAVKTSLIFPNDFIGIYKGKLQIDNPKGSQEIDMEYHLLPTDSVGKFEYKLVYNGKARNYFLIEKNKEKGIYEVDENNGIILPTYLNSNTLHSFFEVQGSLLSSRTKFSKDQLEFEILFTKLKNKVKSGGTSEEVPEVFGYPITVFQKAILYKQDTLK